MQYNGISSRYWFDDPYKIFPCLVLTTPSSMLLTTKVLKCEGILHFAAVLDIHYFKHNGFKTEQSVRSVT